MTSHTMGLTKFLLWTVTDLGADASGLNLQAPKSISPSTIRHDLGLVDLGIRFEATGETVITEREIRAADTRNSVSDRMAAARQSSGHGPGPVYAVATGAAIGKRRRTLHIPDMVLLRDPIEGAPQSIAVELELQHKTPMRVRATLFAYKNATNIGAVVFYTDKVAVRNLINQAAIDTGTTNIVTIRKWMPAAESGVLTLGFG
ncbi:hypothetical protein [Aeromicrobium ginsengisoli]|uniref:hypothetical protein n=1 Tax=Aeromicrobium ginsengisoli TaxID=363867 RepID=UPI001CB74905|nr:hypothetical protein [Aeromicrobium ginsengisoli]